MSAVRDLLQGRPFRSPIHAWVVHFPLACFSFGVILDVGSYLVSDPALHFSPAAFWSHAAGVATALFAALFGFADYASIREDHPARKPATVHMVLNLAGVLLFAGSLLLRRDNLDAVRTPVPGLITALAGYGALLVSGYLGGHLVYNDGVGVGRHRRRTPMPDRTHRRNGRPGEWISVLQADDMQDGEIRRVEAAGTVMAVAKSGGQFFAVQEFCTHRFGPLSEGRVVDGCIQCPWHRSCFELTTGKVAAGPAKLEVKTFPIELRGRELFVRIPDRRSSEA